MFGCGCVYFEAVNSLWLSAVQDLHGVPSKQKHSFVDLFRLGASKTFLGGSQAPHPQIVTTSEKGRLFRIHMHACMHARMHIYIYIYMFAYFLIIIPSMDQQV